MLQDALRKAKIKEYNREPGSWYPFPPAQDRQWRDELLGTHLNRRRADYVTVMSEATAGRPWSAIPARRYMEFERTGNREDYQSAYFARRDRLAHLVLAECFDHRGRFLDDIADGLWSICEEATWCIPAHANPPNWRKEDTDPDPLPRQDRHIVDLFAAQTGMILAEAVFLLKDELESLSPNLVDRVRRQCIERIVNPVIAFDDIHWKKYTFNWNPWCCSNALGTGLLLVEDSDQIEDLLEVITQSVDVFLGGQPEDGGCNEGPGYWMVSAGSLLVLLELLHDWSAGQISLYEHPLIKRMGHYIVAVHQGGESFATFADCPPKCRGLGPAVIHRFGERTGNKLMMDLAMQVMYDFQRQKEAPRPFTGSHPTGRLGMALREIFWMNAGTGPTFRKRPKIEWLPDIQVMTLREKEMPGQGLVVTVKGGHNKEHHNHNDVGHFVLSQNGIPVILDVGTEVYRKESFDPRSYEFWYKRGSGHNAPLIDGCEQQPGRDHAATDVKPLKEINRNGLRMELKGIYEEVAPLKSVVREVTLDTRDSGKACLEVCDTIQSIDEAVTGEVFLFCPDARQEGDAWYLGKGRHRVELQMESDGEVQVSSERWPVEHDPQMRAAYGKALVRLAIRFGFDGSEGSYRLFFRASPASPSK